MSNVTSILKRDTKAHRKLFVFTGIVTTILLVMVLSSLFITVSKAFDKEVERELKELRLDFQVEKITGNRSVK